MLLGIFLLSMLALRFVLWHDARKLRKRPSTDSSGLPEAPPHGLPGEKDPVCAQRAVPPVSQVTLPFTPRTKASGV